MQKSRLRFFALVLAGFVLAGCAAQGVSHVKWSELSPKTKATAMWTVYSGQYDQYLADYARWKAMPDGGVRSELARSLAARKKVLVEAEDAIRAYDAFAESGLIPVAQLEAKALDVLGRLGGY